MDVRLELWVCQDIGLFLLNRRKDPSPELHRLIGSPLFPAMQTSNRIQADMQEGIRSGTSAMEIDKADEDFKVVFHLGFKDGTDIISRIF